MRAAAPRCAVHAAPLLPLLPLVSAACPTAHTWVNCYNFTANKGTVRVYIVYTPARCWQRHLRVALRTSCRGRQAAAAAACGNTLT